MARIGFHASHEQIAPSALLRDVVTAQQVGFGRAMCSDHFAPWSEEQGQSGFAWSWLGAAMAVTTMRFGVVTAPGQRYHPAVLAQAAATLAEMFPDRFWIALGTGQALNEHITGGRWPARSERNARLRESVDVMRALFAGECVDHRGLIDVDQAMLYTRPDSPPPIFGAAVSEQTAHWVGSWADGLITVNRPHEELRKVIDAFRAGGGEGKPVLLQVHLSWADSEEVALTLAHEQWRSAILGGELDWVLRSPDQFAAAAAYVRPDDVRSHVLVSADPGRHTAWLADYAALGVDELYLHHVGQRQDRFLEVFGREVVPQLAATA